jgi:thiamine biosynthesis lipoprotein
MPKTSSEAVVRRARTTLHGPTMGTRWSLRCDLDVGLHAEALRVELAAAVDQVDRADVAVAARKRPEPAQPRAD